MVLKILGNAFARQLAEGNTNGTPLPRWSAPPAKYEVLYRHVPVVRSEIAI
jgi:hypothetical protein